MDPHACLLAAEAAFEGADFDQFIEFMAAYAGWRRKGGFVPTVRDTPGDAFFGLLTIRYGAFVGNTDAIPPLS